MEKKATKIRIKDIATLAGVSEGTVDRVIHQRGDVSSKSKEAVTKVLEEMNYTPNLFARSLASKKQYRFVCIYPAYKPSDYWESIDNGFDIAAQDFIHYNVHIEKQYYNQYDVNSFINVTKEVLLKAPDAVFLAPIFKAETVTFTSELANRHIPFSFIDSMIEDVDFLTYYGQNSFQSGYIAAKIILGSIPVKSQVIVIRTQRNGSFSNQTLKRNNGFLNYMEENNLQHDFEIINVEFRNDDETANRALLNDVFSKNTNIKAAITFNSKVHRLAMHLVALKHTDVRLIGYDLLEKNVLYLQQGVISCLIAQRPDKQAYFTARDMCRELIFHQEIKKINYVPIDILLKENIEYYKNFRD